MVPKELARDKLSKNYDTKMNLGNFLQRWGVMGGDGERTTSSWKPSLNQALYKLYHLVKEHSNSLSIICPNFMIQKQIQVVAQANVWWSQDSKPGLIPKQCSFPYTSISQRVVPTLEQEMITANSPTETF